MNGITMMVLAIVVLGGAYLLYGRYLEKKWGIDPKAKTPAFEMEDGVDYVPARSDQRSDSGRHVRLASGSSVDSDRRRLLWSGSGFRCDVCVS